MNRALQFGGCAGRTLRLVSTAVGCLIVAASCAIAQNATPKPASPQASPAQTTSPTLPAAANPPAVSPPASAPTPVPATPSMMPSVPGTPLDRIVAIVNDDVILDSDVNEELRFEAFDPYRNRLEDTSRGRSIERLINRALILQQLKLQPEDEPSDAEVNKEIDQLRKNIPACAAYHCDTKEGWDRFLVDHGFDETSFFARWKDRMTVLNFIEERFQTGINITQAQVKDYYDKVLLPEYARQHAHAPNVDGISSQIREVLLQQQVSKLLQDWLQSLRAQGNVVVLHPGEEAP